MRYVVDTNVLVQARRSYYNPDYCPGFWEWLKREHRGGLVFSIVAVREEIRKGNDNLLRLLPDTFFLKRPAETADALTKLSTWVESLPCKQARKNEFLIAADYRLVAHAKSTGDVIVTHEKLAATNEGKIKIPNACAAVDAKCLDLWDLFRSREVRFALER